jgi:hypothetical protein
MVVRIRAEKQREQPGDARLLPLFFGIFSFALHVIHHPTIKYKISIRFHLPTADEVHSLFPAL